MFTGLIEAIGTVQIALPNPHGLRLLVQPPEDHWDHQITAGESIAVAGVCLTARHHDHIVPHGTPLPQNQPIAFDVIPETLQHTTLTNLQPGCKVNLERAVRADTLMGGHFVQGHVDGTGTVAGIHDTPADWRIRVALPASLMEAMVPKGSITIDGVSLTIADIIPPLAGNQAADDPEPEGAVEVALIPTTLQRTTLSLLRVGDRVNIEPDMLVKSVVATVKRLGLSLPGCADQS